MSGTTVKALFLVSSAVCTMAVVTLAQAVDQGSVISERVKKLTRAIKWTQVAAIPINFNTYHPQGLVKIGDTYFVSTVDIRKPTTRYAQLQDGYDRDTGEGVGHLIKFDAKGSLITDLTLGEGSVYHPGGIDYDGKSIWVPTAEYRPNSRAILYRVDPGTMKATEVLRYGDHIGGLVYNTESKTLHGVSWGSRRFYRWTFDGDGKVSNASTRPEDLRVPNRSNYIDYQDCKYLGRQEALCSGLNMYQPKKDGPRFALGGLEIVDLSANQAIYQVPVELWTESGLPMTYNPFWIEPTSSGLRAYFMPEDEKSTLYIYEAEVK
ncbi:MAG: DUF6454 family protein [Pseudomonadota bacterium]|nr:DUF6454 family protein [Pseudomonadota bacterium]